MDARAVLTADPFAIFAPNYCPPACPIICRSHASSCASCSGDGSPKRYLLAPCPQGSQGAPQQQGRWVRGQGQQAPLLLGAGRA